MRLSGLTLTCGLFLAGAVHAVMPDEQLADPHLEARARAIGNELRCVVCQNQTIDDSDADLARSLRIILRERLTAGDTDQQATRYIVARYGDFVLLKPPLKTETWLLWFGPTLAVVGGAVGVGVYLRNRAGDASCEAAPLSEDEKARVAELLVRDDRP